MAGRLSTRTGLLLWAKVLAYGAYALRDYPINHSHNHNLNRLHHVLS